MRYLIVLLFVAVLFPSCDKTLLDTPPENDPVTNFNVLWEEFNEKYGLFETKGIDWNQEYEKYASQLHINSTDEELYAVLKKMLKGLNDNHVGLVTTRADLPPFGAGSLDEIDRIRDFDLSIIKEYYLPEMVFEEPFFSYGILEGNIGYIHIEGFSDVPKYLKAPMDAILEKLKDTKGIIIDVRGGYGGEDVAGQYIAGRFTSTSIPYMKTRVKNGPEKNDFTPTETWNIEKEGESQYLNPVVVLTHRFTISARETFCMAMRVLPQVTFMGDTTAGAFSNQINREMPNGWGYSLSIGQWTDADGVSFEGVGLPPDVLILNKESDLLDGTDEALEKAMEHLK